MAFSWITMAARLTFLRNGQEMPNTTLFILNWLYWGINMTSFMEVVHCVNYPGDFCSP